MGDVFFFVNFADEQNEDIYIFIYAILHTYVYIYIHIYLYKQSWICTLGQFECPV